MADACFGGCFGCCVLGGFMNLVCVVWVAIGGLVGVLVVCICFFVCCIEC